MRLSFSQRYGYEPLPEPMQLEQVPSDLRRAICDLIHEFIIKNTTGSIYGTEFTNRCGDVVRTILGEFEKTPKLRVDIKPGVIAEKFEQIILKERFDRLLSFLEVAVAEEPSLAGKINWLFKYHAAAYWLDISHKPCQFFPCSSEEQKDATQNALKTVRQAGMNGAASHLRQAGEAMNEKRYADSVRESIHAVESVARKIGKQSSTLKDALKFLERDGLPIHPALKDAFIKLYGYTNDEQGIRHALLDRDAADVGLDEAIFMFGACASFAAFLTRKHLQVGES